MALENMRESATLTGESVIDGKVVVAFTAHIPNNGISGAVTPQIRDIEAYNLNRDEVRQDQREFQNTVWDKEDEMRAKA